MQAIIDRFEGEFAVCEITGEKQMINIPRNQLPEGAKAGTVLDISDSGITADAAATGERQKKIQDLLDSLWE